MIVVIVPQSLQSYLSLCRSLCVCVCAPCLSACHFLPRLSESLNIGCIYNIGRCTVFLSFRVNMDIRIRPVASSHHWGGGCLFMTTVDPRLEVLSSQGVYKLLWKAWSDQGHYTCTSVLGQIKFFNSLVRYTGSQAAI